MQDPAHKFREEPSTSFCYPSDREIELFKDFCKERYRKSLADPELKWLASLISDYLNWSGSHAGRREMRVAGLKMLRILGVIDDTMFACRDVRDLRRAWLIVAYSLGLRTATSQNLTEAKIADSLSLSKATICKSVRRFLQKVDLPAAFHPGGLNFH